MKYVKMLGLLAVAAAALMAFAGTASATLTSPTGVPYTGNILGTSSDSHLTGTVKITCKKSNVGGTSTSGSTTGAISTLDFEECSPDTVTVLKKGHLTINKGTNGVVSSGAEVTVLTHKSVLGFPITAHCIYGTKSAAEGGTPIGTITDSHATGGHAVIHVHADVDRIATDGSCGEDPATWTGTFTIKEPTTLYVH